MPVNCPALKAKPLQDASVLEITRKTVATRPLIAFTCKIECLKESKQ